jgi:hypothetical protein
VSQVAGSANQVAGPYFDFSVPEPTGVVAVLAPQESSLLGLVSVIAPAIVTGNTVVAVASELRPLPAVTLSEVLATSDVPGRSGQRADRAHRRDRTLARLAHGRQCDRPRRGAEGSATELQVAAADNLKRVLRPERTDWAATPGLGGCCTTSRPRPSGTPSASDRRPVASRG